MNQSVWWFSSGEKHVESGQIGSRHSKNTELEIRRGVQREEVLQIGELGARTLEDSGFWEEKIKSVWMFVTV